MEKVLMIGLISIPLVMFLVIFATDITENAQENAGSAKTAADTFMGAVTD
jgi:hypothetical protein